MFVGALCCKAMSSRELLPLTLEKEAICGAACDGLQHQPKVTRKHHARSVTCKFKTTSNRQKRVAQSISGNAEYNVFGWVCCCDQANNTDPQIHVFSAFMLLFHNSQRNVMLHGGDFLFQSSKQKVWHALRSISQVYRSAYQISACFSLTIPVYLFCLWQLFPHINIDRYKCWFNTCHRCEVTNDRKTHCWL